MIICPIFQRLSYKSFSSIGFTFIDLSFVKARNSRNICRHIMAFTWRQALVEGLRLGCRVAWLGWRHFECEGMLHETPQACFRYICLLSCGVSFRPRNVLFVSTLRGIKDTPQENRQMYWKHARGTTWRVGVRFRVRMQIWPQRAVVPCVSKWNHAKYWVPVAVF